MGHSSLFQCNSCNYSTRISGGPDAIMAGATNTYVCNDCHSLQQLLILNFSKRRNRRSKKGDPVVTGNQTELPSGEYDFFPPYCTDCHSKNLDVWDPQQALCPKCGGKMGKIPGEDLCED
ncbi:MAG: hypothetical protein IPJ66_06155 [Bacteroidetes bacterium]|nr:hypothetical protein [Bacteroidota bacterium]